MSGPALRPVGLRAVEAVRRHVSVPIFGVGGVLSAEDAVAYARAGAVLVQVGTASFAAPRAGTLIAKRLEGWGRRHGVSSWTDLVAGAPA